MTLTEIIIYFIIGFISLTSFITLFILVFSRSNESNNYISDNKNTIYKKFNNIYPNNINNHNKVIVYKTQQPLKYPQSTNTQRKTPSNSSLHSSNANNGKYIIVYNKNSL